MDHMHDFSFFVLFSINHLVLYIGIYPGTDFSECVAGAFSSRPWRDCGGALASEALARGPPQVPKP